MRILAVVLSFMLLACVAFGQSKNTQAAPATPGALTVSVKPPSLTAASGHGVDLTWMGSAAGPNSISGYNVMRGMMMGGPYAQINGSLIVTTSYSDANVVAGTTYYYVVVAVDSKGKSSGYSNEVSALIPSVIVPTYTQSVQSGATSLSFSYVIGASAPALQTIAIIATPATPLPVTVTCDQAWLACSDDSPTTKTNVNVGINTTGLAAGTYNGNVVSTNTDGTAINTPFLIPVKLTVTSPLPTMLSVPVLTTTHINPTQNKVTATWSDAPANFTSYTFFGANNVLQQNFPARASSGKYQISWTGTPQNGMFSVCDSVGACEAVPFSK